MDRSLWRRHKTAEAKKTSAPPSSLPPSHSMPPPLPLLGTSSILRSISVGVTGAMARCYVPQSAKQCHLPALRTRARRSRDATSPPMMLILSARYGSTDPTPHTVKYRVTGEEGSALAAGEQKKSSEMDRSAANPRTRKGSDSGRSDGASLDPRIRRGRGREPATF